MIILEITNQHMKALRRLKEHFGSQGNIAKVLDLTPCTVNDWFRGRKYMPLEQAYYLSKIPELEMTVEDLRPDLSKKVKNIIKNSLQVSK